MTCVWDGLIRGLAAAGRGDARRLRPRALVDQIQNVSAQRLRDLLRRIRVNGDALTEQQLDESAEAVAAIDVRALHRGYLCSTFDPALMAVSAVYRVSIEHLYLGKYKILYEYTGPDADGAILRCRSSASHFSFAGVSRPRP